MNKETTPREIKVVRKSKKKRLLRIWPIAVFLLIVLIVYFFKFAGNYPWRQDLEHRPDFFGVTFSKKYCNEIGLDWKEVYLAILDDLKVKTVRLPIYWDDIEREKNVFDFADYDYMIAEGAKRDVKFIVNIGWRLPRWPECHAPNWAAHNSLASTQAFTLRMLSTVVEHYKDNEAIVAWQVENEPFLDTFGVCPPSDVNFFKTEVATVKQIDDRPIVVSATGELSSWQKESQIGDIFGSTMYRVVWDPWMGYVRYPIPAWFYRLKAYLAGIKPENRLIIELQAEPWVPSGSIIYLSPDEANKSFNLKQFKANLQYAINVDFQQAYLWGAEWSYWQYKNGDPSYWELARTLFD